MVKISPRTLLALVASLTLIYSIPTQAGLATSMHMVISQLTACGEVPKSQQLDCFRRLSYNAVTALEDSEEYAMKFQLDFPNPYFLSVDQYCSLYVPKCFGHKYNKR
jgi:hypothetical protein